MAKRVETVFTDDLGDGTADSTVSFALDGHPYEIDLSKKNAEKFYAALAPYVENARSVKLNGATRRRVSTTRKPSSNGSTERTPELRTAIRAWAKANPKLAGATVGDRGRIPESVYAAYDANK